MEEKNVGIRDRSYVVIFAGLMVISLILYILILTDETLIFRFFRNYFILPLLDLGIWSSILFIGLMILQGLFAPIPSELVLLSGAIIFGFWGGVILGVLGSVLSGMITYYISFRGGRAIIDRTGEKYSIMDAVIYSIDLWVERWGTWAIFVGRAVPVIMFDPVSYAAGLSKINWKPYLMATLLGSIPRAVFYAVIGVQLLDGNPPSYFGDLSQSEIEVVANRFNAIFLVIFLVLAIMLLLGTVMGNRSLGNNNPRHDNIS